MTPRMPGLALPAATSELPDASVEYREAQPASTTLPAAGSAVLSSAASEVSPAAALTLTNLDTLRLEQARQLKDSATISCLLVTGLIVYVAVLMLANSAPGEALLWTLLTMSMVGITWAYAHARGTITEHNQHAYLRGHVWMSCATGLVWSGLAIHQLNPDSYLSLYIALTIPTSITLGGMFPSSAYRQTYIGLLTCCVLPVFVYWLVTVPGPIKYIALGLGVFYVFGLVTSARTEINARDLLLSRQSGLLAEELQRQKDTLEQIDEDKTRVLLSAVHDFSQPLHAQGYFIHALRNQLVEPQQIALLDRIESSWRSQSELMQGIAEINRLRGRTAAPHLADVDIAQLLDGVAAEFRRDALHRDIDYDTTLTPARVHTDTAMLARIVRNLLSNAFKFTEPSGRITLACRPHGAGALVRVTDSGIGIAAADRERIFEEFSRLHEMPREGMGIGLAIVRRLVDLIDIELDLTSEPGQGTCVTLQVPGAIEAAAGAPGSEAAPPLEHSLLVVLVDDEQDIRDGMGGLLEQWGCTVISAACGSDAIEQLIAMERVPGLLIVDQHLGADERGTDLIEVLRDEVNAQVPALLITGETQGLPEPDEDAGVTILAKPVEPLALRAQLNKLREAVT